MERKKIDKPLLIEVNGSISVVLKDVSKLEVIQSILGKEIEGTIIGSGKYKGCNAFYESTGKHAHNPYASNIAGFTIYGNMLICPK